MIAALIAAAMAMTIPQAGSPTPVRPDARPALWVVNDDDTIIYLFGTFHTLDGRPDWFNSEIGTAFRQSDLLVLETLPPAEIGGKPVLPAQGPAGGGASMIASNDAVYRAGSRDGLSIRHGADMVLRSLAENSGKPVAGLEDFHSQIGMIMRLEGPREPVEPERAAAMSKALSAVLADLKKAWSSGDPVRFEIMMEEMRLRTPQTYQQMFADRNGRWAGWIARRLQQPGTVFVAVGAGHLAGRDSVQIKLAQSGIRAARVN